MRPVRETIAGNLMAPEPVGTIILAAFRVTGYDPGYDGSPVARLEPIGSNGEVGGWGDPLLSELSSDTDLAVELEEWRAMFGAETS